MVEKRNAAQTYIGDPKKGAFATPRALAMLANRAARHPEIKERNTAAALLYMFIIERERRTASKTGGRATAAKSRLRTYLVRKLAHEFIEHGVPVHKIIATVRDAWPKHGDVIARDQHRYVPSERDIRRKLTDKARPAGQG